MTNWMRMALTIYHTAFHPAYFTRSCEKRPGNGRFSQMVRAFREFRSERKKRTTSGGCPQFPNRFSGKLPFHLTSNRNFRIFWLNGKHPIFLFFIFHYKFLYYLHLFKLVSPMYIDTSCITEMVTLYKYYKHYYYYYY